MNNSGLQTVKVRWRKVCAVLPAFALIGAGIALTTQANPAQAIKGIAASNDAPAIVVPDVALTMPARTRTSDGVLPVPPPGTAVPGVRAPWAAAQGADVTGEPAPVLPGSIGAAGSPRTALDRAGIPVHALEAYRGAVSLIDAADPSCHVDWALLAAIGSVESNHARFGGNQLDSAGVAQPGIIGIPLDGYNGTARITDSDGGLLDRDSVFDRAVGPMQFIPGTWRVAGADADGDGVKNPQDMADAAAATAIYLCSGPGDLRQPGDLRAAIMRYNASASYVRTVIAIADGYRRGVIALPAPDVFFPSSARSTSRAAKATPAKPAARLPGKPAPRLPASVKTATAGQRPALTHRSRAAIAPTKATPRPTQVQRTSSKPVPAPPPAARPTPPRSTPAKRAPATPTPGRPTPATPIPAPRPPAPTTSTPTTSTPTTSTPTTSTPTTSTPAVPAPVEPTPCPTTPSTPATPTTSTPTSSTQAPAASPSAVDPCSSPCLASAAPPATPETPTPEPTPPCLTPTPDSSPTTPTTEPNCPVTPPGIESCAIVPPVPTPTTTD